MSTVPIVLDLGSATFKGGYAGSESPEVSFTPVCWRPDEFCELRSDLPLDARVGDSAELRWPGNWQFAYNRGRMFATSFKSRVTDNIEQFYTHMLSQKLN